MFSLSFSGAAKRKLGCSYLLVSVAGLHFKLIRINAFSFEVFELVLACLDVLQISFSP